MHDDWTIRHDLAVVYLALAYGPDHQIADRELAIIRDALDAWSSTFGENGDSREVAVEALAVLLTEDYDPDGIVTQSLDRLAKGLTHAQREQAIEDLIRVAEADGMLLLAEREVIALVARHWEVKRHAQLLLSVTHGVEEDWTLLHDIGLVYLILAHSTDNELSDPEIAAIVEKTHEWLPAWPEEDVRTVLRRALAFYSSDPGSEALQRSVLSIGHRLPLVQRLALVNDLFSIAEVDGPLLDAEREMVGVFMGAWNVGPLFQDMRPGVSS